MSATEFTSEVWNHFTRVSPTLVRCNLCQKSFKPPSTTQYWDHLKSHHKEAYVTTEYYKTGVENGIRHRTLPTKFTFNEDQRKVLEESFGRSQFLSGEEKASIAQQLGVQESSIKNWFHLRRSRGQRRSRGSLPNGNATAGEANNSQDALGEDTLNDVEMQEAGLEQSEAATVENAPDPDTRRAPLHDPLPVEALFSDRLHSPQPMPPPQPVAPPMHSPVDGLVEISGRAMMLRLRQLYEKDHKLFLRAQNDISNALFKYEMEDE